MNAAEVGASYRHDCSRWMVSVHAYVPYTSVYSIAMASNFLSLKVSPVARHAGHADCETGQDSGAGTGQHRSVNCLHLCFCTNGMRLVSRNGGTLALRTANCC